MRRTIIAIGVLWPVSVSAYPISPMTVDELAQKAEIVVVAEVDAIVRLAALPEDKDDARGNEEHARLRVLEVWKGNAGAELLVATHSGLICPAPPRFPVKSRVLAFLRPHKDRYFVVGLSYGVIPIASDGHLDGYREAIGGEAHMVDRHAIVVALAEKRCTRWQGLYQLVPSADTRHAFYDRRIEERLGTNSLTQKDRKRLARGSVNEPPFDVSLPMLLTALENHVDPDVDAVAADVIESLMNETRRPPWLLQAIRLLARRGRIVATSSDTLWPEIAEPLSRDPFIREVLGYDETEDVENAWTDVRGMLANSPRLLPIIRCGGDGSAGETPL